MGCVALRVVGSQTSSSGKKKNFCLNIKEGRESLPGTVCGHTQCRVLSSLQHLHVRLSQVGVPGKTGIRENGTYKLFA